MLSSLQLVAVSAALFGPGPLSAPETSRCARAHAPANLQTAEVAAGDRFYRLVVGFGARPAAVMSLRDAVRPHKDLANLALEDRLEVSVAADGDIRWFRYRVGVQDAICARRTLRGGFHVAQDPLRPRTDLARVEVTLDQPLAKALAAAGQDARLAVMVQDVFPEGLPTASEGGEAPTLTVLVERETIEGELLDYGRVFAVAHGAGEVRREAFHFVSSLGAGFYDASGAPRRSTRLRAPVAGGVLTSPYGMRRHPIRRYRRMHKGVDYGAARGTPVRAAADGVVRYARRKRGFGKTVALRHSERLVTRYAHLSRYAAGMRSGKVVKQGDVIGFVGSTGLASGAHLHFETLVDRRQVDPARLMARPAPPIPEEERAAFEALVARFRGLLAPSVPVDDA